MMDQFDMERRREKLLKLLREKLGIKAQTLERGFRRAGRRLPRSVRREAAVLVRAETLMAHPKLSRQIDGTALDRAYVTVTKHLKAIDAADARLGRILSVAGTIAFNLIVVFTAFVTWMWWSGRL